MFSEIETSSFTVTNGYVFSKAATGFSNATRMLKLLTPAGAATAAPEVEAMLSLLPALRSL